MLFFCSLLGCSAQKIKTEAILATPIPVSIQNKDNGRHTYKTAWETKTVVLEPQITLAQIDKNKATFQLQGNIRSGGHAINQVGKIRLAQNDKTETAVTLKYYVEIKRIPGKESANVIGYNYTSLETYKIPNGINIINVELYEDRINTYETNPPRKIKAEVFNLD